MLDAGLVRVARERTREAHLPHNVAREHFEGHILNTLTDMLAERIGTDPFDGSNLLDPSDITQIRDELAENPEVWAAIDQLWPRLTPQRAGRGLPRRARRVRLPTADADAIRRDGDAGRGPPPTCRSSTRPPNCSARTTGWRRALAERERQPASRLRAGRVGRVLRLPDVRVRGQGRGGLRGPLRARHHRRRADGRAARGGRPPQRRRAGGGRPDLGVRAHHRRRGAGAVADGLAAADAAQSRRGR